MHLTTIGMWWRFAMVELTHDVLIPAQVNWDWALDLCKSLDLLDKDEIRSPLTGKTAIRILAEYGAIVHKCSTICEDSPINVAIIVSPPSTWFCPSESGFDGVFIEPYSEEKFGKGIEIRKDKPQLFDYCSISGRLDGWEFWGQMAQASMDARSGSDSI